MNHVVLFSGGAGSWGAAKRVAERHGTKSLVLLFTDTMTEDEDLYRFIREAADNIGSELVTLADGRDVWGLFNDERMMGNNRADICSRVLKRDLSGQWVRFFDPEDVTIYLGIDWTEAHRFERARKRWLPYRVEAPLCEPPYLLKSQLIDRMRAEGLEPPRLYGMGFPHNNCGGFCVKAGQAHFAHLLKMMPERYAYHEGKEQEFRERTGKDVSILRDRKGGVTKPLTLKALRERSEGGGTLDLLDWGGCGCFVDE